MQERKQEVTKDVSFEKKILENSPGVSSHLKPSYRICPPLTMGYNRKDLLHNL